MSKYDINIKRLALLLMPTFFRRPGICGLLYAAVSPLCSIYIQFTFYRNDKKYRLTHNGQVCYLRAVLNDNFDPILRRITIIDGAIKSSTLIINSRPTNSVLIPERQGSALIVSRRKLGQLDAGANFWVNIPLALRQDINIKQMQAIINNYKLASKRYEINFI